MAIGDEPLALASQKRSGADVALRLARRMPFKFRVYMDELCRFVFTVA